MEQLKLDFGDFPPRPLKSIDQPEGFFTVKYINQRTKIWSDIIGFFSLINNAIFNNRDEYISGSLKLLEIDEIFREAISKINNFKEIFLQLKPSKKLLFTVLMLIIIPFVALFFIYNILRLIFNIARKSNSMESLGGYFSPLPCYKDKIFIKHEKTDAPRNNTDSIISHEHIHLLQARARVEDRDYAISSDLYTNPLIILEAEKAGKSILYLLERRELEARLHEVILSFYRKHGELPMTIASLTKAILLNIEITDELFQHFLRSVVDDGSLKSSELSR